MDVRRSGRREAGGIPIDLVLVLGLVVAVVAAGIWYTVAAGGPVWIIFIVAFAAVMAVAARLFTWLRRTDSDGRGRKVGHDSSWTSGREEDE